MYCGCAAGAHWCDILTRVPRYQSASPCWCAWCFIGLLGAVVWSSWVDKCCFLNTSLGRLPEAGGRRAPGQRSSYVRSSRCRSLSSTVELFSMSTARVPLPVASHTTEVFVVFMVVKMSSLKLVRDKFTTHSASLAVELFTLSSFFTLFTRRILNLVLVISTSVMILNGIHCTVSDLRPANVSLCTVTSLQDWHVHLSPSVTLQAIARHVDFSVLPLLVIKRTRVLRSSSK